MNTDCKSTSLFIYWTTIMYGSGEFQSSTPPSSSHDALNIILGCGFQGCFGSQWATLFLLVEACVITFYQT